MLTRFLLTVSFLSCSVSFGQQRDFRDTASTYFGEIKTAAAAHKDLWGYDLYAPLLLVRPHDGAIFANFPDSSGALKNDGGIYTGYLPKTVNFANTSLRWSGEDWAMVVLPLPDSEADRVNLLAHELFHRAQPRLGFKLSNPLSNELDQKEGRISLRLELEALKAALLASAPEEMRAHVTHALTFRRYRTSLYRGADSTENLLELNEGMAEYTGIIVSGRTADQMQSHFVNSLAAFLGNPTFVRSFAYQTIPLYGYLLRQSKPSWNRQITPSTNLADFFIKEFDIHLPGDLPGTVARIGEQYGASTIIAEEGVREAKIAALFAEYKGKFIDRSHLEIPLKNMSISFDPRNIMPLKGAGTVYPTLRVTDNWGILTATNGALMSSNWNKISLSVPITIGEEKVTGDGWTLELKHGYVVRRDNFSNNYILTKE